MRQSLQQAVTWLRDFVWEDDLRELNVVQRAVVFVLRVLHMLLRELLGGQLNLRAMSLVYTTLLSIVPVLAVSFSVLTGFGVHNKIEPVLFNFLDPLGPNAAEITSRVIGFVENVKVGVLGSVGFALLIYTVIALLQKIEAAFNFVWQVEHLRSFSQRFSNYLSVILIGPVLVFSAVGLTATIMNTSLAQQLFNIEPFGTMFEMTGKLIPYFLVCLAFTLIYIFIPNTKVELRAAAIGGLIAGVLWETTGWVFAMFIASSSKYAAIYSSFAILILLLIWLYLSWLILLVGSQIAFYVQHLQYMTLERVEFVLSNRLRERLALQVMYLVGHSHYHNKPPWSLDDFTVRLELPSEPVHRVLSIMVDAGYLVEVTSEDPPVYLPVHDISTLRLTDILARVRAAGEDRFLNDEQLPQISEVDRLVADIQESYLNVLGKQTLKDLVLEEDAAPVTEVSGLPRPASIEQ
ncbi:MAG: YihY/virulence factor BrkB family protein [Gammaproteobacteria bacterium]|nr:MAG: YihY/virulence factor BrkB family protein [Gammaproteobacteria bacterium]